MHNHHSANKSIPECYGKNFPSYCTILNSTIINTPFPIFHHFFSPILTTGSLLPIVHQSSNDPSTRPKTFLFQSPLLSFVNKKKKEEDIILVYYSLTSRSSWILLDFSCSVEASVRSQGDVHVAWFTADPKSFQPGAGFEMYRLTRRDETRWDENGAEKGRREEEERTWREGKARPQKRQATTRPRRRSQRDWTSSENTASSLETAALPASARKLLSRLADRPSRAKYIFCEWRSGRGRGTPLEKITFHPIRTTLFFT